MSIPEAILIYILLAASVVLALMPVLRYFRRRLGKKPTRQGGTGLGGVLASSAYLLASVWCLRYAVGYFSIQCPELSAITPDTKLTGLNAAEELLNSLVHALQTFSMDESYTEYIITGKAMLRHLLGADTPWQNIYGFYGTILNAVVPIAGGAIIFEILASIFPQLKLRLLHLASWKEKYYFSQLNSASLALAKSIRDAGDAEARGKRIKRLWSREILIFTDTRQAQHNGGSRLLQEARQLGALCIPEALPQVAKNKSGDRKFFLIHEVSAENIRTLTELADTGNNQCLKYGEIYIFTDDDAYVLVEKSVQEKLMKDWQVEEDADSLPALIPVRSHRNLISNLLVQVPLYEPLLTKRRKSSGPLDLTVSILGAGHIGTEMFLTVYWIGQILNCRLHIQVLSQETQTQFWEKIDYINPEIRHTTQEGHEILQVNRKGDKEPAYCDVTHYQCDIKSAQFTAHLAPGQESILNTDYFLVSLGNDGDNIAVADTVKRLVGQHHITMADRAMKQTGVKPVPDPVVIAYIVYDTELSDTLNRKQQYRFTDPEYVDIYMCAKGNNRDVYSVENVFMSEHEDRARGEHKAYLAIQNREERAMTHKNRIKDDYKHWASLAQSMHEGYRLFSSGVSLPSRLTAADSAAYQQEMNRARKQYVNWVTGKERWENDAERIALLHKLAWLEHRRWCAFTRTMGFRQTDAYGVYADPEKSGTHKQLEIKLHPCLVECDQNGIRMVCDGEGYLSLCPLLQAAQSPRDYLDELSDALYEQGINDYDFKLYDYPMVEKGILDGMTLEAEAAVRETAALYHQQWCERRKKAGWKYGGEFNSQEKTDPCLVSFAHLPEEQQKNRISGAATQYKVAQALGYSIKTDAKEAKTNV